MQEERLLHASTVENPEKQESIAANLFVNANSEQPSNVELSRQTAELRQTAPLSQTEITRLRLVVQSPTSEMNDNITNYSALGARAKELVKIKTEAERVSVMEKTHLAEKVRLLETPLHEEELRVQSHAANEASCKHKVDMMTTELLKVRNDFIHLEHVKTIEGSISPHFSEKIVLGNRIYEMGMVQQSHELRLNHQKDKVKRLQDAYLQFEAEAQAPSDENSKLKQTANGLSRYVKENENEMMKKASYDLQVEKRRFDELKDMYDRSVNAAKRCCPTRISLSEKMRGCRERSVWPQGRTSKPKGRKSPSRRKHLIAPRTPCPERLRTP